MRNRLTVIAIAAAFFFSCNKANNPPEEQPATIIKAAGNIQEKVNAFKSMLGPLNTTTGVKGGHREINWDGVPDSLLDKPLPEDFFNPTGDGAAAGMQRGVTYSPGTFVVSANSFASIISNVSDQFTAFSGNKTFANTTAARWDVAFQKAGTTESASVQAFGLVFSDVDDDSSTSAEFFDSSQSLGKYFVPAHDASSSFSFLGVSFKDDKKITRVTIEHDGFLAEGTPDVSQGGARDLIVLDDFIYSEPK